ncbi:MAG: YeiH family protein [Pyrinomonadaceae bacterium]
MPWRKVLYFALVVVCLSPLVSPPAALALGLALALTVGNPFPGPTRETTRYLLRICVVLLGFGLNLNDVYRAGRDGLLFTIATIAGTLVLGYILGRALKVGDKISTLISSGTAICGGSAIAAVGPAIEADSDEMTVSLGAVFVLNSIALFLFPVIGVSLGLTQDQFGIWAAIAIHDTSSVVGAAAAYGQEALGTATVVKLTRALWIAPVALFFAFVFGRSGNGAAGGRRVEVPWFIFLFVAATVARSYAPSFVLPSLFDSVVNFAKAGMTLCLFFIGATLSRETIRKVGARPLIQGLVLWIAISVVSLAAVLRLV